MDKIKIKVLNEVVYHEKLENGLDIYVYKKPGFQKKMAYFQTKYGSLNNDFIPLGKKEMRSFPLGIAHFLEHKLFESNDDSNVFEKFEKNGASVNASTSYDKTVYYFSAADHFFENLDLLIDMVQNPYFTDANVSKEKGIIGQELDMYSNNPNQAVFEKLFYNSMINSPLKYDIGGTKEEVNKITKEDLYECYNTFYHPSNMSLIILGDVDEKEVINFIKEKESKRNYDEAYEIVNKEYVEPEEVEKKEENIYHNVTATKIGYCYKLILPRLSNKEEFMRKFYMKVFLATRFGGVTDFTEDLIKKELVKSYFYYDYTFKENIFMIFFTGDVLEDDVVSKMIKDKLNDLSNLEEMFDLYKKNYISSYVKAFESLDSIQASLRSLINTYGVLFDDIYELYSNASFKDYLKFLKTLSFKNHSKIIIKSEEEKKC